MILTIDPFMVWLYVTVVNMFTIKILCEMVVRLTSMEKGKTPSCYQILIDYRKHVEVLYEVKC